MNDDWGHAIVIDPRELQRLRDDVKKLGRSRRRRSVAALALACTTAVGVAYGARTTSTLAESTRDMAVCQESLAPQQAALNALARSHENILAATQEAPSVGTKSWGRRFTVTKYIPNHRDYGKFNDGLTATMTKADPARRVVAVDPKLIPYGSWVWVEDLGWYRAEDCGGAIKGFRLDLLTATTSDAMAFGKQERFVIVVPPEGEKEAKS